MRIHRSEAPSSSQGPQSIAPLLSRRDLIRTALLAGASATLGPAFSFSQTSTPETAPAQRGVDDSKLLSDPNWKPAFLDQEQNETLIALSDVIIPATDTPGAKEALVNRYLDLVLAGEPDPGVEHFDRLKSMIAVADYTSEIGERELGWDGTFTHGPFQGCDHPTTTHK